MFEVTYALDKTFPVITVVTSEIQRTSQDRCSQEHTWLSVWWGPPGSEIHNSNICVIF